MNLCCQKRLDILNKIRRARNVRLKENKTPIVTFYCNVCNTFHRGENDFRKIS